MILKPLEFSECLVDSPWFRQNLHKHEDALEESSKKIKNIEQQCRKLITCTTKLSQAQLAFSTALGEFSFETIGSTQTDDERIIANSLKEFGKLIRNIEDQRKKIIDEAEKLYLAPLQNLVDKINHVVRDERHKYKKESNSFYSGLEKHLHLSVRKSDFSDADLQLENQQRNFCQASLQYVSEIQSVQERIKFEFVETLSSFLYNWLSFYHIGHTIHEDFCETYSEINHRVKNTKDNFETTQAEAAELRKKMLAAHLRTNRLSSNTNSSNSDVSIRSNNNIKQGYVFMQERSILAKTISRDVLSRNWTKYYCAYSKESRIFTMIPVNNSTKTDMKTSLEQSVSFKLKSCVRRASDSIDKRFCFDIVPEERSEVMTLQALSEEDRRQWLDAMDGREPVYSPGTGPSSVNSFDTMLDETGFKFVNQCISALNEEKRIKEMGIYRNCGVTSKVQRLLELALDKRKSSSSSEELNFSDETKWETKTISSAIKTYLRNLPEPLMTFDLHQRFVNAAKLNDVKDRLNHIHYYVYKLPESHKRMLELIIRHLRLVSDNEKDNLMTVRNLGVCFGPTLLRPREETMAAIMEFKFFNVVVEILITFYYDIFNTKPPVQIGTPCPPKPTHNLVPIMAPANDSQLLAYSKSVTASSTSIAENLSNQKSISTEGFSNTQNQQQQPQRPSPAASATSGSASPIIQRPTCPPPPLLYPALSTATATTTTTISNTQQQQQMGSTMGSSASPHYNTVRQRQPPPPPLPRSGASSSSKSSQQQSSCINLYDTPPNQQQLLSQSAANTTTNNNTYDSSTNSYGYSSSAAYETIPPQQQQTHSYGFLTTMAGHNNNNNNNCGGGDPSSSGNSPRSEAVNCPNNTSSDSLNSAGSERSFSSSSAAATATFAFQQQQKMMPDGFVGSAPALLSKGKMSSSYAPAYNPLTYDNITYRLQKRHSGGNLLMSSNSAHSNLANYAPSQSGPPLPSTAEGAAPTSTSSMTGVQQQYQQNITKNSPIIFQNSTNSNNNNNNSAQQNSGYSSSRIPPIYSNFINPTVQFQPSRRVRTLYSCGAGHETELSFEPGQIITNVYESKEEGWLVGTLNGKTGLIPANYVEHILGP